MEFTKAERGILINQFEVLKHLEPDLAKDYDQNIKILQSGFTVFYDEVVPWLCDDVDESVQDFVFDVLNMYRALEAFYRENPDTPALSRYNARFNGFDGNEETEYYSFAHFLLRDQGKYAEQLENPKFDTNSHCPRLDWYSRMVSTWKRLGGSYDLTEEQVLEIVPE